MKRRAIAPDGRSWVVQLVWWPRPGAFQATGDADIVGGWGVPQLLGLFVDAIHIVLWPLVFALRVVLRRTWLIEAFQSDNHAEGAAWCVRGLGASASAVGAIATGIEAGNRDPAPPGASPTHFRVRWGPLGTPR
jgi:hypothetical protein